MSSTRLYQRGLARRRALQKKARDAQHLAALKLEVASLLAELRHSPIDLGLRLAELDARQELSPSARRDLFWHIADLAGESYAREVFGFGEQRASADALSAQIQTEALSARTQRLEVAARRPGRARRALRKAKSQGATDEATQRLVDQLTNALGIAGQVDVRTDEAAGEKAKRHGTRGLLEGETIFLRADSYDAETPSGRRLVAHEMTHLAQRRGGPQVRVDAALAEAEAHVFAEDFAAGRQLGRVRFGVPKGDVAREDPAPTIGLLEFVRQFNTGVTPQADALGQGDKTKISADGKQPKQNRQEKFEQYCDGVDGIADKIGDKDAFDDLCDDVNDDAAMRRLKRTSDYKKLCDMWQGAKEGGADSARMKRAFNYEFDGRGFWASTEKAFARVCREAKRDAKPHPDANKAKEDAGKKEEAKHEGGKKDGKAPKAQGANGGKGPGAIGDVSKRLNEKVPERPPELKNFNQAQKTHNSDLFAAVSAEYGHFAVHGKGFKEAAGAEGADRFGARFGQVMAQFGKGVLHGAIKGWIDQGADTMILDTLGTFGDLGLKALTKGKMKAPFVGPFIAVVQSGLIGDIASGNILDGKFIGGARKEIGKGWEDAGQNWDKMKNAEGLDAVGYFFAASADFVGMLADIIDLVANVMGILSSLAYVIGGILILVGLALIWLGFGAGLISAGGWLIRAGQVLGKIVSALGPISIALNLLATFLRMLAALMVPAEAYATQLEGVGKNASKTSGKINAKIADTTATVAKDRASKKFKAKAQKKESGANKQQDSGGDEGGTDAQALKNKLDQEGQKLEQTAADAQTLKNNHGVDEATGDIPKPKKQPGGDDPDAPTNKRSTDDDPDTGSTRPRDADAPTPTPKPKKVGIFREALSQVKADLLGSPRNLWDAGKELGKMMFTKDGIKRAAYEGAGPARDEIVKSKEKLDAKIKKIEDDISALASKAESLKKQLDPQTMGGEGGGGLTPSRKRELQAEAAKVQKNLSKLRGQMGRAKKYSERLEAAKQKLDSRGPDDAADVNKTRQDAKKDEKKSEEEAEAELQKAKDKQKKAEEELPELRKKLAEADKDTAAYKKAKQDLDKAQKRVDEVNAEIQKMQQQKADVDKRLAEAQFRARAKEKAEKAEAELQKYKEIEDAHNEVTPKMRRRNAADEQIVNAANKAAENLDVKKAAVKQAETVETTAKNALVEHTGKKVRVDVFGNGKPKNAKVVGVSEDGNGLIVQYQGQQKTVPWRNVTDGKVKAKGESYKKAQGDLQHAKDMQKIAEAEHFNRKKQAEQVQQRFEDEKKKISIVDDPKNLGWEGGKQRAEQEMQKQQGIAGDYKPTIPTAVNANHEAQMLSGQSDALARGVQQKKRLLGIEEKTLETRQKKVEQEQPKEDARVEAKKKVDQAEKDASGDEVKAKQKQLDDMKARADAREHDQQIQQDHLLGESKKGVWNMLSVVFSTQSSGNAPGGVGSAYDGFIAAIAEGTFLSMFVESGKGTADIAGQAVNLAGGDAKTDRVSEDRKKEDEEKKKAEEAAKKDTPTPEQILLNEQHQEKKKGLLQQGAELWANKGQMAADSVLGTTTLLQPFHASLVEKPPPFDPAVLGKLFEEAEAEAKLYAENHAQAFAFYQGELMVDAAITIGEAIQNGPAKQSDEALENQKKPLAEGKAREEERKQKLSGKDTGTKKGDPQGSSTTGGIVSKLMSNKKYAKNPPDSSKTKKAGGDSVKAQDKTDKDSKETKKKGGDASSKQKENLVKMETARAAHHASFKQDRANLANKTSQEKAMKAWLQQQKAQHLVKRDKHGVNAELKAEEYNVKMASMINWAAEYKQKRQAAKL